MKFLALLAALAFEQVRPLRADNALHAAYERHARYLRHLLDAGEPRLGLWAWVIAVAPLTVLTLLLAWMFGHFNSAAAWLFSVAVLYVTVGFRKFSNYFNEINKLMKAGDMPGARDQLRQWRNADAGVLDANALARVAIEQGLMASHRHVFGPVAWFLVCGPAGALFYFLAAALHEVWRARAIPNAPNLPEVGLSVEFAQFAARAFAVIDWLPARLTAASFAAVGNFQDAVDCWRAQAASWPDAAQGIILSSGAGALGVKLGGALTNGADSGGGTESFDTARPELGTGDEADADHLSSAVGLIWRALVMWMLLAGVVTIAHSLG
jgi:adenosylcobinamide-phosphate synthase